MRLSISPTPTHAAMKIPVISLCPKCGIIKKSGKASCCARGGSWFENCGSAGNTKLDHTWKEGIRVCNARQSHVAVGYQLRPFRPKSNASSDDASMHIKSKAVTTAAHVFASAPADTSTRMPDVTCIAVSANLSAIAPDCMFVSKEISATTATMVHSSVNTLISKTALPRQANGAITKSMRIDFVNAFSTTTSYILVSESITVRGYAKLFYAFAQISSMLLFVSC